MARKGTQKKNKKNIIVKNKKYVAQDPKVKNYSLFVKIRRDNESSKRKQMNSENDEEDILNGDTNDEDYAIAIDSSIKNKTNTDEEEYSDKEMEEDFDDDLESELDAEEEAEAEEEEQKADQITNDFGDGDGQFDDFEDAQFDGQYEDEDEEDDDLYYGAANAFNEINVNCGDISRSITTHLLYPQAGTTTEEFSEDMVRWKALQNVSNAATLAMLKLIRHHFPDAKLPLKESKNGRVSLDLDSFTTKNPRNFEMHVCRAGCSSFINDSEKDMICSVCPLTRFRPCTQHNCTNPTCNPFSGELGNHCLGGRDSYRSIHYCPVIPLFKELAQKSIEKLVGGEHYQINSSHNVHHQPPAENEFIDDIKDSAQSKLHLASMNQNFREFVQRRRNLGDDSVFIEASFIFSLGYDGGTLFKRGSKAIWPLVLTLLNCNPSVRFMAGIGMFLAAIHDLVPGCAAEQSMFLDLFVPELNLLSKGIHFSYRNKEDALVNVFLQSRLVCHTYDTPAGQKVFNLQGVGSLAGCLYCNSMKGLSRMNTLDKIINMGHRCMLPDDHILRYFGFTKLCCPIGYYDGTPEEMVFAKNAVESLFKNSTAIAASQENLKFKHLKPKPAVVRTKACDCPHDEDERCNIESNSKLFNDKYSIMDFRAYLFFAHCDFRKSKKYARRPNSFYKENGSYYDRYYDQVKSSLSQQNERKPTAQQLTKIQLLIKVKNVMKNKNVVEKCQGISGESVYSKLRHYRGLGGMENCTCHDCFHSVCNFCEKCLTLFKGVKGASEKSMKQSLCENRFPFQDISKRASAGEAKSQTGKLTMREKRALEKAARKFAADVANPKKAKKNQYTNVVNDYISQIGNRRNLPWLLSLREQQMVDWRHMCIIIPYGLKDSYSFKFMFKHTGYLKGNDKLKWLSVFIHFDMATTSLPKEYKTLLRLISELVSDILSPLVSDAFIAELFMRTVEALCLWEGMFPDSEQYFAVHELLDIVDGMNKFGPVRGWWTLAGERFMGRIKSFCPKGGLKCLQVIFDRFVNFETSVKKNGVVGKNHEEWLDNFGNYSDIYLVKLIDKNQFFLGGNLWSKNDWLMASFTEYLYTYLKSTENKDLVYLSPYFRLYTTYFKSTNKKTFPTFWKWINYLHEKIISGNVGNIVVIVDRLLDFDNEEDRTYIDMEVVRHRYSKDDPSFRVLRGDIETISEILKFIPSVSLKCIVKGLQFRGRGPAYCELKEPLKYGAYKTEIDKLSVPYNQFNELKSCWSHPKQTSAYVKFRSCYVKANKVMFNVAYAQVNYFSVLKLPSDRYLDNLPFANITARDHHIDDNQLRYIKVNTSSVEAINAADEANTPMEIISNYNDQIQFVALNYIESTNVAICGFAQNDKPILTSDTSGFTTSELAEANNFCSKNVNDIVNLYVVDLHPNRKLVDISAQKILNVLSR